MDIREQIDDQFAWMEEPCSCGDVYSHPDGGDSQCRYCSGAMKLRDTMEKLLAVYEAAKRIRQFPISSSHYHTLDHTIAEVEALQTRRDPEDFNLWCATHQIPKTSYGCTYPDCDCTVPEKP